LGIACASRSYRFVSTRAAEFSGRIRKTEHPSRCMLGDKLSRQEVRQRRTAYVQQAHRTYFPSIERALSSGALEIRIRPENG
jgi:hypothetical protein